MTGSEITSYTYDNNGNTLSKTSSTENIAYSYDDNNRLISVDDGTDVVEYAYDTDGMRVRKSVNGDVINYLLDKNRNYAQVLKETDGNGSEIVFYTYGDDLISQKRGSLTSFYHYDGQFSTRQLSDASGQITDTYTYDAFGLLLARSGSTENNYLYTGEQYDPNVGFYYLRARYYNPSVGRFLTQDTWPGMQFEPMSLHRYLYCESGPVGRWDPSGNGMLLTLAVTMTIGAILGGIIGAIYANLTDQEGFWKPIVVGALIGSVTLGVTAYVLVKMGVFMLFTSPGCIFGMELFGSKVMLHWAHHEKGIHFVLQHLTEHGNWRTTIEKTIIMVGNKISGK